MLRFSYHKARNVSFSICSGTVLKIALAGMKYKLADTVKACGNEGACYLNVSNIKLILSNTLWFSHESTVFQFMFAFIAHLFQSNKLHISLTRIIPKVKLHIEEEEERKKGSIFCIFECLATPEMVSQNWFLCDGLFLYSCCCHVLVM